MLTLLLKLDPTMNKIHITKIICFVSVLLFIFSKTYAQTHSFVGRLINDEYNIYLEIDFYRNKILIPGQEIYGEMAGYLGDYKDGRKWFITNAKVNNNDNSAILEMVNDYGSEDLEAELTKTKDNCYTLKQLKGTALKIARNRKWVKLPKILKFKTEQKR